MANQLAVVFLTVSTGTATYILGQIFIKLFIEPVHEKRQSV